MKIPSNLIPISKWSAFKGNFPPNSPKLHNIIIIYHSVDIVCYFYVTSQIDNAKRVATYDIKSIAEIGSNDWNELTKDSCVQCNKMHLYETTEQEIRDAYEREEIIALGHVPEIVKNKIIEATNNSKTFTSAEKELYTLP